MSYPSRLSVLIIEDEVGTKAAYEAIFQTLSHDYDLGPVCYAFCYDDAQEQLAANKIFHLVILDLKIPEAPRMPEADNVDYGMKLVGEAASREGFPIPALLVVSGHIGSTAQTQLRETIANDFYYGQVIVKGLLEQLTSEIRVALDTLKRYVGVGVHMREDPKLTFPTLSPRDEDLLRRFVLKGPERVGLDLAWWSADKKSSYDGRSSWTKVLVGRVLLDTGDSARTSFFKLMPREIASYTIAAARRLHQKLSHVKLEGSLESSSAALLVTEKVGPRDEVPVSLTSYLRDSTDAGGGFLETIATQIVRQIRALGDSNPDSKPLCDLLWKYHSADRLRSAIRKIAEKDAPEDCPAMHTLASLQACTEHVRFNKQTFLHGDLHAGNIALDSWSEGVDAFIFDAGATEPHIEIKDIATLEVSLLLHQRDIGSTSIVRSCQALYETSKLLPEEITIAGSALVQNTYSIICHLRSAISERTQPVLYALMVFDAAMIQLGGLDFELSTNKIALPYDAYILAGLAAAWLERLKGFA